jgi:hypothetical protein
LFALPKVYSGLGADIVMESFHSLREAGVGMVLVEGSL